MCRELVSLCSVSVPFLSYFLTSHCYQGRSFGHSTTFSNVWTLQCVRNSRLSVFSWYSSSLILSCHAITGYTASVIPHSPALSSFLSSLVNTSHTVTAYGISVFPQNPPVLSSSPALLVNTSHNNAHIPTTDGQNPPVLPPRLSFHTRKHNLKVMFYFPRRVYSPLVLPFLHRLFSSPHLRLSFSNPVLYYFWSRSSYASTLPPTSQV